MPIFSYFPLFKYHRQKYSKESVLEGVFFADNFEKKNGQDAFGKEILWSIQSELLSAVWTQFARALRFVVRARTEL